MNHSIDIFHKDACYSFRFRDTRIFSIERYVGELQIPESISWTAVPQEVKKKVLIEMKKHLKPQ